MKNLFVIIFLTSILLASCQQSKIEESNQEEDQAIAFDPEIEKAAILKVLKQQEKDWNEGNIESFMEGYWKSDNLKFVGSSGVSDGWEATLARYKRSYPDLTAMGKLRFEIVSTNPITEDVFLLIGKFFLTREIGDLQGIFSLVWKKENGKWVVAADHTTPTTE